MLFPEVISLFYGVSYANDDMYVITVIVISYTVLIIYKQALARSVAVYEMQWIYLIRFYFTCDLFCFLDFIICFTWGLKDLFYLSFFLYIFNPCFHTDIYSQEDAFNWNF